MSDKTEFGTFWVCRGEKIFDYETMAARVEAGEIVSEVSAESQRANAENVKRAEEARFAGLPAITPDQFKPYWLVNGVRCDELATVRQKVLAGAVAVEISAKQQAEQARSTAIAENRQRELQERRQQEVTRQRYVNSPERRKEGALRTASQNPGGIVTPAGRNFGFEELDAYGPERTNVLQ